MKQKPMTTKELISKLQKLDPDGNKKVYLEKVIYGAFSDGAYHIQEGLTDNYISVDKNNHIKFTI